MKKHAKATDFFGEFPMRRKQQDCKITKFGIARKKTSFSGR